MSPEEEQKHLTFGADDGEQCGGAGIIRFSLACKGDSSLVLQRCREVLREITSHSGEVWPTLTEWQSILPQWFIAECAAEETNEAKEKWLTWWRTLPPEQQSIATKARKWSLNGWLYWLHPDNRQWFWWNAFDRDANTVVVSLQVKEWPFAWGAFEWLARVSGATTVKDIE